MSFKDVIKISLIHNSKDVELATGLGAAIGLLIIEFMGFFSGLSMFGAPSITLTSIIAHATATVALGKDCSRIDNFKFFVSVVKP